MSEASAIRETQPGLEISPDATTEQRLFLEGFQTRLLERPELYHETLDRYLHSVNSRQLSTGVQLHQVVGDLLSYIAEEPQSATDKGEAAKSPGPPDKLHAIVDWHEYLHGQSGVYNRHLGFDPASETEISNDMAVNTILKKVKDARKDGDRSLGELTERLRVARFNNFLGRVMLLPNDGPKQNPAADSKHPLEDTA